VPTQQLISDLKPGKTNKNWKNQQQQKKKKSIEKKIARKRKRPPRIGKKWKPRCIGI